MILRLDVKCDVC